MKSHDTVIDGGDVIVVGAGLAGLYTALKLAPRPVTVLSPRPLGEAAATSWAQGGLAAAVGSDDAPELHVADTIAAGAGLVDEAAATVLATEAPERIADLARLGVPFDRDAHGDFVLGREGAHSRNRIVKVSGDRAGAAVMEALIRVVEATPSIRVLTGAKAYRLGISNGAAAGVFIRGPHGPAFIRGPRVVLATGGLGALYKMTTDPLGVLGEGVGMAALAGAAIADPEFVQFHPTAMALGGDPAPLATEALRGEGAILVTETGDRFMPRVHAQAELAPRDVVARAIHTQIMSGRRVFLDCRDAVGASFPKDFPTVYAKCKAAGVDPVTEPIPVCPAAHYHMGGVNVDLDGRSTLPGLWACGEVSSTGVHGANRLASNSLVEAVVFGKRIAENILGALGGSPALSLPPETDVVDTLADEPHGLAASPVMRKLRTEMTDSVGLVRSAATLRRTGQLLQRLERGLAGTLGGRDLFANVLASAKLVTAAAYARRESRGGHFRSDYPESDETQRKRTVLHLEDAERILEEMAAAGPLERAEARS